MSGPERTVMFQLPSVVSGQLVCVEGSVAGRSWDLSAGTFVIGRKEGSDLFLPNEPGVSKTHAKIVAEGSNYRLTDAESRNGTLLNGAPTQSAVLNDGDLIQVCGCKLRFTQTSDGSAKVRNPPPPEPEVTDPVVMAPPVDATLPDQPQEPPMALPPTGAFEPPMTELSRAAPVAPAVVEVRGNTLWSFFTGLFAMLICGGGAYAALLYLNDGKLPPPDMRVEAPADGEIPGKIDAPPAGDTNPSVEGDPAPVEGQPAEGEGAEAGAPAGDPGEDADPAADDEGADPATDNEGVGEEDPASDEPTEDEPTAVDEPTEQRKAAATSRRRTRRVRKKPAATAEPAPAEATPKEAASADPSPAADPEPEPVEAVAVESAWVKVKFNEPPRKPIRVPGVGRVQSVDVGDGDVVSKGQELAVVESSSASAAEIATKRESITALKSIVEASGDPEAQKLLSDEEAALKQMLASSKRSTITAPMAGKLEGFRVKAGETLRARLVVGFVRSTVDPSVEATVEKIIADELKPGAAVTLKLPAGKTAQGKIRGTPIRKAKNSYKVTVVADGVDLSTVTEVKLP